MIVKPFPAPGPDVIAVIGGGFSGTLVAVNLARQAGDRPLHILLFERGARFARGVAYGTTCPQHLLNVPAGLMKWRAGGRARPLPRLAPEARPPHNAGTFAPRRLYGEYLEELLANAAACNDSAIELVRGEASTGTARPPRTTGATASAATHSKGVPETMSIALGCLDGGVSRREQ